MQIHELNNFSGIPGNTNYLAIDDGADTGRISGTDLLAPVNDRVDNILNAVTVDSEVIDGRVGADGITYGSLGTAIRSQVSDLTDALSAIVRVRVKLQFTSGAYIETGNIGDPGTVVDLTPVTNSSYSYTIVNCNPGDSFEVNLTGGNAARAWAWLTSDNKIISNSASGAVNTTIIAPDTAGKVVFNDNSGGYVKAYMGNDVISEMEAEIESLKTTKYVSTTGSDSNDGNTPSTPYATISKALSATADVIYVEDGTYTENIGEYTAYRYRGVKIIADKATLVNSSTFHFRFADVEITGLNIQAGSGVGSSTSGMNLYNCTGRVSDCSVSGFPNMGFRVDGSRLTLERCVAKNCGVDGFNGHTITTGYETDCTFIDCEAYGNGDDGLSIHEGGKIHVFGGKYYNNLSTGIAPHQFCNFEIRNAYIYGNGTGIEAENPNYTSGDTKAIGLIIGCIISANNKSGRAQSDHIGYGVRAKQYVINALGNAVVNNNNGTYYQDTGGEITVLPITAS